MKLRLSPARVGRERLYQRESRWLLGVCRRIFRDTALAEDALHDTLMHIWQ